MMKQLRLLMLATLVSTLCPGLTTNVGAQRAPQVEEDEFVEVNSPVGYCGDFIMIANGAGRTRLTTYFNQDGEPIRLLFQGRYRGTLTNSVTGASISDSPSVANIFVDLVKGTQTNVGAFYNLTIPGRGAVLFEAGRIVFAGEGEVVFVAGPHRPSDEAFQILCSALR